ncbi:hypothetical protein IE81DRAFT_325260 [Ceraceosorus guamensis]|uniref:Uncharacterized protein n=1 Tax=Ceraceosorus guamensis TaxID=1522189 RepID=A0A316VWS7_9BASI|nr:hypothetical protein IE81DRAFT_325260 [Ceraceosorus guamensis]PWN40731.1 hypothetical protein IE81DRAFT_325260 [Ceraceosorus guamensis]
MCAFSIHDCSHSTAAVRVPEKAQIEAQLRMKMLARRTRFWIKAQTTVRANVSKRSKGILSLSKP